MDTIFKICDKDGEDGLKIEEVKNSVCMEALGLLLGETEESLEMDFKLTDADEDNIISKKEANSAIQQLNRSATPPPDPYVPWWVKVISGG